MGFQKRLEQGMHLDSHGDPPAPDRTLIDTIGAYAAAVKFDFAGSRPREGGGGAAPSESD